METIWRACIEAHRASTDSALKTAVIGTVAEIDKYTCELHKAGFNLVRVYWYIKTGENTWTAKHIDGLD